MSVSQVAANAKKKDIDEAKETSDDFAFQTDEVGFLPFSGLSHYIPLSCLRLNLAARCFLHQLHQCSQSRKAPQMPNAGANPVQSLFW